MRLIEQVAQAIHACDYHGFYKEKRTETVQKMLHDYSLAAISTVLKVMLEQNNQGNIYQEYIKDFAKSEGVDL